MKASDAARTAILVDALEGLSSLAKTILKPHAPTSGERRALEIQVSDLCSSGGSGVADIELDPLTGSKLLPLVRRLIEDELVAIGVTLDKPKSEKVTP